MATEPIAPGCLGEDPIGCLLLKLRLRDTVSAQEEQVLRDSVQRVDEIPAGRTLIRGGEELSRSILLSDGLIARTKDLSEGKRQITEIHVPGDFVDLHGFLLKRLEHDVAALSAVRVAYVPHERLRRISEEQPHLARLLWLSTLIDAAIQRERILSIGRRSALARVAHLLCELYARLDAIGLSNGSSVALPLTQTDLGDATGLTSVHVNRMLRQLRERGLATLRDRWLQIDDKEGLFDLAEFDPSYLYNEHRPR